MKREWLKVEIKQNGAGRLYFVMRTPAGQMLLVSQSFPSRAVLDACLACLKEAFKLDAQQVGGPRCPSYAVSMDAQGVNLLSLYPGDGTLYLLSGGHSKPQEFMLVLGEIKDRISRMRVLECNGYSC